MESLAFKIPSIAPTPTHGNPNHIVFDTENKPLDEKVKILILRDLWKLGWHIDFNDNKIQVVPPSEYDKATIKHAMSIKRDEIIRKNQKWIENHLPKAQANLADGVAVLKSRISPIIEVCEKQSQHDLFRILRYYWSSPYSEYVGRRMRLIIRDNALPNKPVIGIAALGSPIIHIPERDEWIGWDKDTRTKNLIYTMDAYVIGALPPYNHLLGGKLISYILASRNIRQIYREKYKDKVTLIEGRTASKLAGLFTTSLYGKSSQYNRMKFRDELLYKPIGETKGYGTLHLSEETIHAMQEYLKSENVLVTNRFGDGPSWTMRVIRNAGDLLGFDSNVLLQHSFKRNIYFVPLAANFKEFLNGDTRQIKYNDYSLREMTDFWKERWYSNRKERPEIYEKVISFKAKQFTI